MSDITLHIAEPTMLTSPRVTHGGGLVLSEGGLAINLKGVTSEKAKRSDPALLMTLITEIPHRGILLCTDEY